MSAIEKKLIENLTEIATVILAAGYGTRMKSDLPKVMHPVAGRPMVEWSVIAAEQIGQRTVVVVGHGKELVQQALGQRAEYAEQHELLGTGHAVMHAQPLLQGQAEIVVVFYADMPVLQAATIRQLVALYQQHKASGDLAVAMLTIVREDSQGFGRIVRNAQGQVQAIVEEVDCTPEQKAIRELNPGIYCFTGEWLWANLSKLQKSAKGEYYLTDMVGLAIAQGKRVVTISGPVDEVNGINTRVQLAHAAEVLRGRILERHMLAGVTIVDPHATYIDDTVEIGSDTMILPGCMLQGQSKIGRHSLIGPHSQVIESTIGDYCRVTSSMLEHAHLENHVEVGPFSHLRHGAHLADGVHIGNFGEVKNSYLGPGTKMGHFSYIGDSHLMGNVNVGAGTITCNFDGQKKHKTTIGQNVFLGSDTLLVAPVTLGNGARTGAGAVVTRDVAADTLVYGVPARPAKQAGE